MIARRAEEQRRSEQFGELLDDLSRYIPSAYITWISREGERLHHQVLTMCRSHGGRLNYNDALMALFCREQGVRWLVSFDRDFDEVAWLERLSDPKQVRALAQGF